MLGQAISTFASVKLTSFKTIGIVKKNVLVSSYSNSLVAFGAIFNILYSSLTFAFRGKKKEAIYIILVLFILGSLALDSNETGGRRFQQVLVFD